MNYAYSLLLYVPMMDNKKIIMHTMNRVALEFVLGAELLKVSYNTWYKKNSQILDLRKICLTNLHS